MSIEHTIVIIKQHTTTIQTLFSLIWTTQQEIKGNIFKHQTLSHHIFMNKQPFQKVKASLNSALKNLFKTCVNLRNHGARKLTYLEGQWWSSWYLVTNAWNRWNKAFQMLISWRILPCGCLPLPKI
jgi:hypothetical protein